MTKPLEIRTATTLLNTATREAHKMSLSLAGAVNALRAQEYNTEAAEIAFSELSAAVKHHETIESLMIEAMDGLVTFNLGAKL